MGCDLIVFLDVGGDALAHGDEPGLGSPLCDAVMLAAADLLAEREVPVLGALFGTGCDGELTPSRGARAPRPRWRPRAGWPAPSG